MKEDITEKVKISEPAPKSVVREWTESIIIAVILALIIRTFIIQPFKIPSGSMRMTLVEGDRLFVSKWTYGNKIPFTNLRVPHLKLPKRGDIVVFIFPGDGKRDFIKRFIAKGGETVEIREGHIYVDGKLVDEPRIRNIYYYNRGDYGQENRSYKVPPGHLFVLGDNSLSSNDSRYWGSVPENNLVGRAELIYWPLNRIRLLNDK